MRGSKNLEARLARIDIDIDVEVRDVVLRARAVDRCRVAIAIGFR